MIQKFVKRFMDAKQTIEAELRTADPEDYDALVKRVVQVIANEDDYETPSVDRITVIDHGDYQGTRLYIIAASCYQPSRYWSIFVDYGSCSGCDTLESLKDYSDGPPDDKQVNGYWTLMLHMVQSMRELGKPDDAVDPDDGTSSD
jgi:hypothetical protein